MGYWVEKKNSLQKVCKKKCGQPKILYYILSIFLSISYTISYLYLSERLNIDND